MNRTLELQQSKAALLDAGELIRKKAETEKRSLTPEERTEIEAKIKESEEINATLALEQRMSGMSTQQVDKRVEDSKGIEVRDRYLDKPFGWEARTNESKDERKARLAAGFGEQLLAIRNAALNPQSTDPRLLEINKRAAPSGAGIQVPSDGGFLVYPDFSTEIMTKAHETGLVYSGGYKLPLSAATNAIKVPGIDEQSRVDGSRWGGVRMYWQNEADTLTGSKPKYRLIELVTKKLTGLYYATDELIADAAVLGSFVTQAFGEEVGFKMDDAAVNGDGAGKPLGIMNSPALITVAKESGQTNTTIVLGNIVKMWGRCWGRSRLRAVWFINQDIEQQLWQLSIAVGTAGGSALVAGMAPNGVNFYTPPGANGNTYALLMGRPVIPIEQCQTLGTVGDIILADMSQWMYCDKGDVQQATSMHVRFLNDEMTFRCIYRVDGQPIWNTGLTPFTGSNTLSPFVTLAGRP